MKIVRSSDVPIKAVEVEGASRVGLRWLITREDGAENFAMRMFEIEPGGHTPLHTHAHDHEVFAVEGRGVLVCEDAEHAFEAGYVMFVPPEAEHCFKNTGDSLLKMLCLIPGSAY